MLYSDTVTDRWRSNANHCQTRTQITAVRQTTMNLGKWWRVVWMVGAWRGTGARCRCWSSDWSSDKELTWCRHRRQNHTLCLRCSVAAHNMQLVHFTRCRFTLQANHELSLCHTMTFIHEAWSVWHWCMGQCLTVDACTYRNYHN